MPTVSDNCWHATAFTRPSKTEGKRGGFSPRKRCGSGARRLSRAAGLLRGGEIDADPEHLPQTPRRIFLGMLRDAAAAQSHM